MDIQTVRWHNQAIKIIDQTKLPLKLEYIYIRDLKTLWKAIKILQVRGAPALGVVAGLGIYLGIKDSKADNFLKFKEELDQVISYISSARPTARNLFFSLERMQNVLLKNKHRTISLIKKLLFQEAEKIIQEDRVTCRKIGKYGAKLIKDKDTILTICNTGILATIDYGTALGVIYCAKEEGKDLKIFSCETRPLLQGARLTSWELKRKGIDVTLICDNMAATLMKDNKITKVIAGADRIAANGDTANKIGTYNLALLSHYHKIPFYIAAPSSTFDLSIKNGSQIPIEERAPEEVTKLFFKQPIAPRNIRVFNPAFDVTAHYLISAIITDKGIIKPPYLKNIRWLLKK